MGISDIFSKFDKQWALVTAGKGAEHNTMTVSWGGMGTLWNKPAVTVYVRPSRYTHEFLEREELFTVSFYGEQYRRDLATLGRLSGRDCDKVANTGLTPMPVETSFGQTVTFAEAELTLVCRKMYRRDMDKAEIRQDIAAGHYDEDEPAHTVYIGELVAVLA